MKFDPVRFFAAYRSEFGPLKQSQVDGLNALLYAIEHDETVTDVRHLAYMLATVKHETAETFKPIREIGKGKGRKYGAPDTYTAPDGTTYRNVYYGRGYVQLTWLANYLRSGQAAGAGDLFARQPDLVMEPGYAFRIMVTGMTRGLFTGKKLSDYIAGDRCDYKGARRIINGTDRAALIAGYATRFERILRAAAMRLSAVPGSDKWNVVPARLIERPLVTPVEMRTVPVELPEPDLSIPTAAEPIPQPSPEVATAPPTSWKTTTAGVLSAVIKIVTTLTLLDAEVIPGKYKPFIAIAGGLATMLTVIRGWLTADATEVQSLLSKLRR